MNIVDVGIVCLRNYDCIKLTERIECHIIQLPLLLRWVAQRCFLLWL